MFPKRAYGGKCKLFIYMTRFWIKCLKMWLLDYDAALFAFVTKSFLFSLSRGPRFKPPIQASIKTKPAELILCSPAVIVRSVPPHLSHTDLLHLVELPLHSFPVPLQLPLSVSQPLQVFLVLLLLILQLLLLLLQLLVSLQDLLLLQRLGSASMDLLICW